MSIVKVYRIFFTHFICEFINDSPNKTEGKRWNLLKTVTFNVDNFFAALRAFKFSTRTKFTPAKKEYLSSRK